MKSIHRDLAKIRALIEAIKEAKIAGYVNPVAADWVLEEPSKELVDLVKVSVGGNRLGPVRARATTVEKVGSVGAIALARASTCQCTRNSSPTIRNSAGVMSLLWATVTR
jgi:hypothetical protein